MTKEADEKIIMDHWSLLSGEEQRLCSLVGIGENLPLKPLKNKKIGEENENKRANTVL